MGHPFAVSGLLNDTRVVATTAICGSGCALDAAEAAGILHNQL